MDTVGALGAGPPDGRQSLGVVAGLCSAEAVLVGLTVWSQAGSSAGLLALDISVGILGLVLMPALHSRPLETGYLLAVLAGLSMGRHAGRICGRAPCGAAPTAVRGDMAGCAAGTGVCDGAGRYVPDADRADEIAFLTREGSARCTKAGPGRTARSRAAPGEAGGEPDP